MTLNWTDFNHGASPAGDEGDDISIAINTEIDRAFYAKRAAEPPRDYVGASAIGEECLRRVQFGYMRIAPDRLPEGKMLRIWETGHVFEREIGNWLTMAGFELDVIDPETKQQFGFSVMEDEGQGHFDGICRSGPLSHLAYPFLWECKALNQTNWNDLKKKGLAVSKPVYAAQVALGQGYLKLPNPAIFTALNKNTSELLHFKVPFDVKLAQRASDNMGMVIDSTASQTLLPRAFNNSDHFKCKMCSYNETCWRLPR